MILRTHNRRLLLSLALFALLCGCIHAGAQAVPPADHDPIASPEGDAPPPASTAPAGGQLGTVERTGTGFVLKQDTNEVVLNATVVDQNYQLVSNLDKSAFQVYEDGVLQSISGYKHEDTPISLGILIDSSGSMYNKVESVRKAAFGLIQASNPEDETFIVNFSEEAYIDQSLTSDLTRLRDALNLFHVAGGTAIYDTVLASADYLSQNAKKPKQVLLIITDGDDHDSTATLDSTIRRVQDLDGPVVYAIGLLYGDDEEKSAKRHSQKVLQTLADQTGGLAFFPRNVNEVDAITAQVAKDIRAQYTLGYHSTKPYTQTGYRQIHVDAKVKGMGKLLVRTRSGYYPKINGEKTGPAGKPDPSLQGQQKQF